MVKRRDSCTAVLFLVALSAAVIYLLVGSFPSERGFDDTHHPTYGRESKPFFTAVQPWEPPVSEEDEEEKPEKPERRSPLREMKTAQEPPRVTLEDALDAFSRLTEESDTAIHETLDRDHLFIELYGSTQKLLGRKITEDTDPQYTVVKLENDQLTFSDPDGTAEDMTKRAEEMVSFVRRVSREYHTPVLYVQAPGKTDISSLPEGLTDSAGQEADQFLELLQNAKVNTLDLRPVFREAARKDPEQAEELFFRTDHHWTPAGAFLGFQTLCERLNSRYGFTIDESLTDPDSYEKYTFADIFLGSQGRRTGSSYAGLDDLEIWSPKAATHFTYSVPVVGVEREGSFVTTLLFPERLAGTELYNDNPYDIYAGGDHLLARAVNHDLPEGKRVLVLRDSFGCGLTPFLSTVCGEVMTIDPRQFNGNQDILLNYIDWLEPDLILILNTTSSLRVDKMFPYLPSARARILEQKRLEGK